MGFFDNIIGYWGNGESADATQAKLDAEDAKLAELNRKALESGKYDQADYDQAQKHLADYKVNVDDEISAGFEEGFNDGVKNLTDLGASIGKYGSKTAAGVAKAAILALWPWLLIVGAYFFFTSPIGLAWLRKMFKKARA